MQTYTAMTAHLVDAATATEPRQQLREIVDTSFDERSFIRSNLRAWLAIWSQVASNEVLNALHRKRYRDYRQRIEAALCELCVDQRLELDPAAIARRLIALIDGLWLEYCLRAEEFSLQDAKRDCYRFLQAHGVDLDAGT